MEKTEIESVLAKCDLFSGLDASFIKEIADYCTVKEYRPGQTVFTQGDFGESLYIIAEGQVFVERTMDLGDRKGKVLIGILGKKRAFGCWSALLGQPHDLMASATCHRKTTLISFKGSEMRGLMIELSELGFEILQKLCIILRGRIRSAYGAMEKL